MLAQIQRRAHRLMAAGRDPPAARTWDLGDQPVWMQPPEAATDPCIGGQLLNPNDPNPNVARVDVGVAGMFLPQFRRGQDPEDDSNDEREDD